jgi:hypothetical protein
MRKAWEVGQHQAVAAEGRIERPACVVAGQREVVGTTLAYRHDFVVRLQQKASDYIIIPEVGVHLAVAAERGVGAAVCQIAGKAEVAVAGEGGLTGSDYFTVRL